MKSSAKNIRLTPVDDLFSTDESRADAQRERVVELPLAELHPFRNHPFKVLDDEKMADTAQSIREHGVLVPAIVRPREEGGYEIVAGHRRHHASQIAGLDTMPAIIRDLDDDAATIIMVDSNLQRETLLPSERAWAYKMKLDAMKRQAGRPLKENCSQVGNNFSGQRSSELMAQQIGESKNQIFRFIRLTELIPPLLDMVDERKIAFNPAVELSYLKPEEQVELTGLLLWKASVSMTYTCVIPKRSIPSCGQRARNGLNGCWHWISAMQPSCPGIMQLLSLSLFRRSHLKTTGLRMIAWVKAGRRRSSSGTLKPSVY